MALGEQVLELNSTSRARPPSAANDVTTSTASAVIVTAGASLRADTNGMSSRGRDLSQFSHGLTGRYGTMASILDT
jgi:hypothetical protein